jgi:hypothetical protein
MRQTPLSLIFWAQDLFAVQMQTKSTSGFVLSASTVPVATDLFVILRFNITSTCLTISVNKGNRNVACFMQKTDVLPMSMSSFMFGFEYTNITGTHFHGSMNGVAIWKRLLLDSEEAQLNRTMDSIDLNDSGLLAFYDMTVNCQGTSLMDRSGHQQNATLHSTTWICPPAPEPTIPPTPSVPLVYPCGSVIRTYGGKISFASAVGLPKGNDDRTISLWI